MDGSAACLTPLSGWSSVLDDSESTNEDSRMK